jgi:hypothetical protein
LNSININAVNQISDLSVVNQIDDDSEEIPIVRHKTADQNLLKEMIKQKDEEQN